MTTPREPETTTPPAGDPPTAQEAAVAAGTVIGEEHSRKPRRRSPRKDAPLTVQNSVNAALKYKADKDEEEEPVSRLIEQSHEFFGLDSWVAAGAFSALEEHGVVVLTRKQAREVIQAWLDSPVEGHEPEDED